MMDGPVEGLAEVAALPESGPTPEQRRVLVVDDEPDLLNAVRLYLEMEGYLVLSATDGLEALDKLRDKIPDLIVLDVLMPGMDGFETLRKVREISHVPVIMLTVRGEETDKVRGLQLGADDYVTKPFSQRELLSRIQAVLRRSEMPASVPKTEIAVDDDLSLDFSRNTVTLRDKTVALTPTEYRLLYHLVSNPGRVLTYETLLAKVWGYEYREEEHYVRLYINYLRQKIEPDPSHPRYILTERGLGYRFIDYRRH
jgi:two-component system KDP operon response regulator KdpE